MAEWLTGKQGDKCGECDDPDLEGVDYQLIHGNIVCEGCIEDMREAEQWDREDDRCDEDLIDGVGFADPHGRSALRAETPDNPRCEDCPTCGAENVLTPIDRARGYQCDSCADRAEDLTMEY